MNDVMAAVSKAKRTLFAHAPFIRGTLLATALHMRRILRKPHQGHYSALRLIKDNPNDLYVDVGANHGQSIESIRLYKKNRIVSFEANPIVGAALKSRYPNEEVHAIGLGKENRTLVLHIPAYKHALFEPRASLRPEAAQRFVNNSPVYWFNRKHARVEQVICKIRTLDSFNLAPFLVKIDVESMEADVIEGGMVTIEKHRPLILLESVKPEVMHKLAPLGYRRYGYAHGRFIAGAKVVGDAFLLPDAKLNVIGCFEDMLASSATS